MPSGADYAGAVMAAAAMTWLDRASLFGMAVADAAACAAACGIGVAVRRLAGGPGGGPPARRR